MEELDFKKKQESNYLKEMLYVKINQQKMLNNTLCEMISKNSPQTSIKMIKDELNKTLLEMEEINKELEKLNVNENKATEEVTYKYYETVEPDTLKEEEQKGFYDSIIKTTKTNQFKESVAEKNGEKYDYSGIYEKVKENYANKMNVGNDFYTKRYIEELRNTADDKLLSNRFLVNLKDALSIPETMISSVSFDVSGKMLSVCIYDFVTEFDGKEFPIMEVLKYSTNTFDFEIKRLGSNGDRKYTEHYSGCRIGEVFRDPIDYSNNDFSKIQIFITYDNVEFYT